jgi:hypothetical protein
MYSIAALHIPLQLLVWFFCGHFHHNMFHVSCCRAYFGSAVGFHLSFLNALTTWLLAPAAVSAYLLWALQRSTNSSSSSSGGQGTDALGEALVQNETYDVLGCKAVSCCMPEQHAVCCSVCETAQTAAEGACRGEQDIQPVCCFAYRTAVIVRRASRPPYLSPAF